MTPAEVRLVVNAAHRFRQALESTQLQSVSFEQFPRGSCGDASELLGQYLQDEGLGTWMYCSGMRDGFTHAWIERDDVIVDITADQFDDVTVPVVVTNNRSWHARFTPLGSAGRTAGLDYFTGPTAGTVRHDYERLVAAIRSS